MKKVKDLSSLKLDALVAKIEGIEVELRDCGWAVRYPFDPEGPASEFSGCFEWMWVKYSPSTDWGQGGPIIEREKIRLWFDGYQWCGYMYGAADSSHGKHGETPLIAAMRTYVASVYDNEVRNGAT